MDVFFISVTDLCSHGEFSSVLNIFFNIFWQNAAQVKGNRFMPLSDGSDNFSVNEIVGDDFSDLGEMPSIPFLETHDVVVDFLIKLVEQRNGLDDHDVDLFS